MKKVVVKGPALSQSGYGEACRFALRALRKFPERFDVYILNTPWGRTGYIWEDSEERQWIDSVIQKTIQFQQAGGKFDTSLQVVIPSEFENLAPENIGYTAGIETTKISPKWFEGCFRVNKILLTSNHAKFGIENTIYEVTNNQTGQKFQARVETPMEVTSYPVRIYEPKEIELDLKHDFNFLAVCQWGPRKNLESLVKCFIEEFGDKNVGLVIKTQTMSNCLIDREHTEQRLKGLVEQYSNGKERKCSIQLLHGDLTAEEMTYIYRHPKIKAMFNLTHGEGFGLPIFEAIYNGLPVVAPAWSGQTDFIYMPIKDKNTGKMRDSCMIANVSYDIKTVEQDAVDSATLRDGQGKPIDTMIMPDSQWCFPKEWHAKHQLREIFKNYKFHKSRALKLQQYVLEKFETNKMLNNFADAICEDFSVINIQDFLVDKTVPTNANLLQEVVEFS